MKTFLGIATLLTLSVSQASQLVTYSMKTHSPIKSRSECPVVKPVRFANTNVSVSQLIQRPDPETGAIVIEMRLVCPDLSGKVPVFEVPDGQDCFAFESTPDAASCDFNSTDGTATKANISGVIFIQGQEKVFSSYLTSEKQESWSFEHNYAMVFAKTIQKLQMNVTSSNLKSNDPVLKEQISATVIFKDSLK